jgi:hypothetical protein
LVHRVLGAFLGAVRWPAHRAQGPLTYAVDQAVTSAVTL